MIAKLIQSCEIAPNVRHFVFEASEVPQLAFTPGQFVSLTEMLGGKKITRPYSIASAPDGNRFEICSNLAGDSPLSPHLFAMKPGDTVEMAAPLGFFAFRNPCREAIFVATGTGIAPFRSMIHTYLGQGTGELTLIFGVRYEHSLMYGEEFEQLANRHANFHFWPILSRPGAEWTGRTGHVQNHLLKAIADRRDVDVYACGRKAMVDDVRALLRGIGFDRKQIIYEKYD